jgi:hypothetical protein
MSNDFEYTDSEEKSNQNENSKRKKVLVGSIIIALLLGSGGGTYYYFYSSAKSGMSEGCIKNMQGIGESFRDYQLSSHKPGLFDDASTTPSSYYSSLSGKLGSMKSALDENSFYPDAKKALKALESFNDELDNYRYIKGKVLRVELANPALSELSAWATVTRNNTYRFLTDPAGMKRLENLGYKYERNWNAFMKKNIPNSDYVEMNKIAKQADVHFYEISELCRIARK